MPEPEWASWTDDQLLSMRLCDLGLSIAGTDLERHIGRVNAELRERGLTLPHYWLSDEWFTPDGIPGVAIPFYLAHPRLAKLELDQMLEVEGGDPESADDSCDMRPAMPRQRVPASSASHAAEALRNPHTPYPEYYTRKALQQELRAASRSLVRAKPPR